MYSVNPLLISYVKKIENKRFFILEKKTHEESYIIKNENILFFLLRLPKKFNKKDALFVYREIFKDREEFKHLWNFIVEEKIIIESSSKIVVNCFSWVKHNWFEAWDYHTATKDYPFLQMNYLKNRKEDFNRMGEYYKENIPPNIFQNFNFIKRVKLKKIDEKIDLNKYASIKANGIFQKKLSILFDLCFGYRRKVSFPNQGVFINKATPSGGARHPVEVFFVSFGSSFLDKGIYHYNVQNNSLDLIKKGNFKNKCRDYSFDLFSKYKDEPFGFFVFTVVNERAMWRYREPRSWRAVLIDVGHSVMLFRKISNKLGFDTYTYQKFKDLEICNMLGINIYKQTPLYISIIT